MTEQAIPKGGTEFDGESIYALFLGLAYIVAAVKEKQEEATIAAYDPDTELESGAHSSSLWNTLLDVHTPPDLQSPHKINVGEAGFAQDKKMIKKYGLFARQKIGA